MLPPCSYRMGYATVGKSQVCSVECGSAAARHVCGSQRLSTAVSGSRRCVLMQAWSSCTYHRTRATSPRSRSSSLNWRASSSAARALARAEFAQKVRPARSTQIRFEGSTLSSKSKYEPDASFRHEDAQYPGVIVEVAYSQKKPCLGQLAKNYILDSDVSVRAVVCVHIKYDNKRPHKAMLSICRL